MTTPVFVSRYYCPRANATTFVHKRFRDGSWTYTHTVLAGNVRTHKPQNV